ncbi:MAG: class I SAM-dependent methyltransferase [Armatimonadota bacterium]|nr:class I SAM-dependent methyltransferase [Armatimonadota bacterium]
MRRSYASVTELPGMGATREQLSMLYTRYRLAVRHAAGKDVLEVACGPGIGLGYLARAARTVVGSDFDEALLGQARATYGPTMRLVRLDAHTLPFAGRTFDLVLLYEALYYLSAPERFLREARRLLRPDGTLLISTVNRLWSGFNPSPYTFRYFTAPELRALLRAEGFDVALYAAFPARSRGAREAMLATLRRAAVSLHLIPPSMRGKTVLKRLVYGPLAKLPAEARDGMAPEAPLVRLEEEDGAAGFKVLYVVAHPS